MPVKLDELSDAFHSLNWDQTAYGVEIDFKYCPPPVFESFTQQPPGLAKLRIKRNKRYALRGSVTGQGRYDEVSSFLASLREDWTKFERGTLLKPQIIHFSCFSSKYSIVGHFFSKISEPNLLVKHQKLEDCIANYKLSFSINAITVQYDTENLNPVRAEESSLNPPMILVEWCLNAPRSKSGHRLRGTKYNGALKLETQSEDHVRSYTSNANATVRDHFKFSYHEFLVKVRFIEIPEFAPFSEKLAVEYYSSKGTLPTAEQRTTSLELLSFLFGRQLLTVGHTIFESTPDESSSDRVTSFHGQNPWGDDIASMSRDQSSPPIEFDPVVVVDEAGQFDTQWPSPSIEEFINTYLPVYEKQRSKLALADLLWGLWTAQPLSSIQRLPIYSSSLECAAKAFLNTQECKLQHLADDHAKTLRKAIRRITSECLKRLGLPKKDIRVIEKKLTNFNYFGVSDRIKLFFELIRLKPTETESNAIKMRHGSAHGDNSVLSTPDHEKQQNESSAEDAYRTLLHRVFLRILGYHGSYIDYGALGFPEQLDEPLGQT